MRITPTKKARIFIRAFFNSVQDQMSLQLDFDVYTSGQVELHQGVNRFVGWIHDVHQALVGADFELVT